jgi:hypothetical protein
VVFETADIAALVDSFESDGLIDFVSLYFASQD